MIYREALYGTENTDHKGDHFENSTSDVDS